jgi:uncharacterized protein (DUF4415 family)
MHKEYDFSQAERARDVPHLARLRAAAGEKHVVMVHIEADIVSDFERRHDALMGDLNAWVNQALREWISTHSKLVPDIKEHEGL